MEDYSLEDGEEIVVGAGSTTARDNPFSSPSIPSSPQPAAAQAGMFVHTMNVTRLDLTVLVSLVASEAITTVGNFGECLIAGIYLVPTGALFFASLIA